MKCPLPFFSPGRFIQEHIDKIILVQKLPEGALAHYDYSKLNKEKVSNAKKNKHITKKS